MFFSVCLQIFSLSFIFRNLIIMCLSVNCLDFSCLEFSQLLESVNKCILLNLRSIQLLFIWIFFQGHSRSPLLLGVQWQEGWIFCYCPKCPWSFCSFKKYSIYSLLLGSSEFNWSVFCPHYSSHEPIRHVVFFYDYFCYWRMILLNIKFTVNNFSILLFPFGYFL